MVIVMFKEILANINSKSQRNLLHGVGINDSEYIVRPQSGSGSNTCPFYSKWSDMIKRCYSSLYQESKPTYVGCSVSDEWLTFSKFKSWMINQDWQGMDLDKDIIKPGNKIYSPDNCCFVSRQLNNLLNNHKSKRGDYPQGVSLDKRRGLFQSYMNVNGKKKHLGYYSTPDEASDVYIEFKSILIINEANKQIDYRVKNGLYFHAQQLRGNAK